MNEQFNDKLLEIITILSRVDSTTDALVKAQEKLTTEIDNVQNQLSNVHQRLTILETLDIRNIRQQHQHEMAEIRTQISLIDSKVQQLDIHNNNLFTWIANSWQLFTGIVTIYLAYKLGINP